MMEAISNNSYYQLQLKLKEAKDKQGVLGKTWNEFKEITGLGQSYSDCEKMADKFKNGEISLTDAIEYIQDFEDKQNNIADLKKNIITGTAAIVATAGAVATGGALAPILLTGAAVGAAAKTATGIFDRATNNIKNDELEAKTVIKDVISGATTGAASALPSGAVTGKLASKFTNKTVQGMVKYGACSALCGATSGAIGYTTDVALNEDKKFNFGELLTSSASSALVSGTVGAGLGAFQVGSIGERVSKDLKSLGNTEAAKTAINDSAYSATRKVIGRQTQDVLNALS